jgi:hypothetical protein
MIPAEQTWRPFADERTPSRELQSRYPSVLLKLPYQKHQPIIFNIHFSNKNEVNLAQESYASCVKMFHNTFWRQLDDTCVRVTDLKRQPSQLLFAPAGSLHLADILLAYRAAPETPSTLDLQ